MSKVLNICLVVLALILSGCGEKNSISTNSVVVGIPPISSLVSKIVGDKIAVTSALPAGRSPHDYAPRPATIREIANSKLYLFTGLPFEQNIAKSLEGSPVKSVNISSNIVRIPMGESCDHDHDHDHDHGHSHSSDELDPHVWLSPSNSRILAEEIHKNLVAIWPEFKDDFDANFQKLLLEIDDIEKSMVKELAPYKGRKFFVHHAAFGYFAHASGLEQQSIELGGREISPARLAEVIKLAKENNVKTIFVQPQFNPAASEALAEAIGGEAVELDPLAEDLLANFRTLTGAIAKGFKE